MANYSVKASADDGEEMQQNPARRMRILDLASRPDRDLAADLLAMGSFGFVHFANIIGLFCEPSAGAVGDLNEFKGSERAKPVSVTARMESVPVTVDEGGFPPELPVAVALEIATSLNRHGPVGFIFPASGDIPDHLSVATAAAGHSHRTVQVITAGRDSRFDDFVLAATARLRTRYFAATSANLSGRLLGSPAPVHYRMKETLKEFRNRAEDNVFVAADPGEAALELAYPYHDARSTTIVKLFDVARDADGAPRKDAQGRHILEVARWGSLDRGATERIISAHGYGTLFPANRVERRSYP